MKLTLRYIPNLERPWLLKREGGAYEQHAHFFKIAMQRLLTEEEFKSLEKKQRYININKGCRSAYYKP